MKASKLTIGDRIRLKGVPGDGIPGYCIHRDTVRVYKKLIARGRSVRIYTIDGDSVNLWFACRVSAVKGREMGTPFSCGIRHREQLGCGAEAARRQRLNFHESRVFTRLEWQWEKTVWSSALWHLTLARFREFVREPAALFWVYGFPLILAGALGLAFSEKPVPASTVDVQSDPAHPAAVEYLRAALSADPGPERRGSRRGHLSATAPHLKDGGL